MSSHYKNSEVTVEFDWVKRSLLTFASYKLNKYMSVELSLGLNPKNRQSKSMISGFGIGFKYETKGTEDLMDIEPDFSEYEYDKL